MSLSVQARSTVDAVLRNLGDGADESSAGSVRELVHRNLSVGAVGVKMRLGGGGVVVQSDGGARVQGSQDKGLASGSGSRANTGGFVLPDC